MDEKGLGKVLQRARQDAGLTQQQLCLKANLSFSTLTKIERGAIKAPSIFTVQAIATALGSSLDALVGNAPAAKRELLKTKSGASFIYFDVNGCLVHFYQRAFAKIAVDTGQPVDAVEQYYLKHNDEVCQGMMSMTDFNEGLAKQLGVDSVAWQDYYMTVTEPIEDMHELLAWASKHYRIGLLTNIMPGYLSTMRRNGLIPDLQYDVVIDSSVVGLIKPDPKIYKLAAEKAGVPDDEILLVDDTPSNLAIANKLGWHIISFDDARPLESAEIIRDALEPAV